ncbi:MAG: hypothetical protein FGM15_06780 [Chthoniobacterales bacterium]|nr:hypothetical protein [Chthoniobacterales bacterium]
MPPQIASEKTVSRRFGKLPTIDPEDIPNRVRDIAMMRGLGYSFREIAQQFHVTPQAISLMLSRHRRSLKLLNGATELTNLSARAANALGRHGISGRSEARSKNVLELLSNERNCGRKTLDEIERWLSEPGEQPAHRMNGNVCGMS